MFLIRTAFWLMIIILLLPTDSRQQSDVYGTAQAAVKDVTGFCERNPDACAKGMNIFSMLVQKAQFGAHMLVGFFQEQSAGTSDKTEAFAPAPDPASEGRAPAADPISWDPFVGPESRTQDTLNPDDLEVDWGGTAEAGA